jgi:hypothetical protein
MGTESDEVGWPSNYFNYFTEIEEQFQKARGSGLFLLSPLDWALIETWKNAGVPLVAVLRGIDAAFEKWRERRNKLQLVNSLAYCSQAVLAEAQALAGVATESRKPSKESSAPFSLDEMQSYFEKNIADIRLLSDYKDIADSLERIASESSALYGDLEQLEQRLTALEEKMIALARSRQNEDELFRARRELDQQLRPYRGKMSAEQLSMLERQYLERALLESAGLPRLSLFYLR